MQIVINGRGRNNNPIPHSWHPASPPRFPFPQLSLVLLIALALTFRSKPYTCIVEIFDRSPRLPEFVNVDVCFDGSPGVKSSFQSFCGSLS